MSVSQEPVAAQPGAAGDSPDSDAARVDESGEAASTATDRRQSAAHRAQLSALEAKRLFLDRVIAWHESSRLRFAPDDPAREGANLLSLRLEQPLSSETLRRAIREERNVLLRF